jgi:hypothetical protein
MSPARVKASQAVTRTHKNMAKQSIDNVVVSGKGKGKGKGQSYNHELR